MNMLNISAILCIAAVLIVPVADARYAPWKKVKMPRMVESERWTATTTTVSNDVDHDDKPSSALQSTSAPSQDEKLTWTSSGTTEEPSSEVSTTTSPSAPPTPRSPNSPRLTAPIWLLIGFVAGLMVGVSLDRALRKHMKAAPHGEANEKRHLLKLEKGDEKASSPSAPKNEHADNGPALATMH